MGLKGTGVGKRKRVAKRERGVEEGHRGAQSQQGVSSYSSRRGWCLSILRGGPPPLVKIEFRKFGETPREDGSPTCSPVARRSRRLL